MDVRVSAPAFRNFTVYAIQPSATFGFAAENWGRDRNQILQKYLQTKRSLETYTQKSGSHNIYYTRKLSGFVQILNFIPAMEENGQKREPSELKMIPFGQESNRDVFLALLNSNLFYWLLTIYSDCRNLNKREVFAVRFDPERATPETIRALRILAAKLMEDFQRNSRILEINYQNIGQMKIQAIYPKFSKGLIDEIDDVLADYYGFSQIEVDYLKNFDVKYRLGKDMDDEDA